MCNIISIDDSLITPYITEKDRDNYIRFTMIIYSITVFCVSYYFYKGTF